MNEMRPYISIRDVSPCKGCTREMKRPGCHDHCPDYIGWAGEVARVNKARSAYRNRPFSMIK